MQVKQIHLVNSDFSELSSIDFLADLVLVFASKGYANLSELLTELKSKQPEAIITGCSTSGEIYKERVSDDSLSVTAIKFEKTKIVKKSVSVEKMANSYQAGMTLGSKYEKDNLKHLMVFSDGLNVNGAELVNGLKEALDSKVSITGGLAGDGPNFDSTFIIDGEETADHRIIGVAFYGDNIQIGFGSKGGWDSFGIERIVTKSDANILYELDGQPALELYKSFLGSEAEGLPGSGLRFPLSMREKADQLPLVRTILAVNEEDQSVTFAGNVPEGSYVRLMKANIDRLIDGAEQSAEITKTIVDKEAELAILISCVGRRLVLNQLVEEEVEAVRGVLGDKTAITGFYSYGEIAPFGKFSSCELHNQTMTITTLKEI